MVVQDAAKKSQQQVLSLVALLANQIDQQIYFVLAQPAPALAQCSTPTDQVHGHGPSSTVPPTRFE